ncbi:MAG: Rho termination factor N-terminal domain-containing protein [Solirubrobacterales bacterium]
MKKKLALGIAGASAALIAGFRLVQERSERSATGNTTPSPAPVPSSSANGSAKPAAAPSNSASKAELYETARELKIEGRSKMSKAELIKAIEAAS